MVLKYYEKGLEDGICALTMPGCFGAALFVL